jgi:hypothetical protein
VELEGVRNTALRRLRLGEQRRARRERRLESDRDRREGIGELLDAARTVSFALNDQRITGTPPRNARALTIRSGG